MEIRTRLGIKVQCLQPFALFQQIPTAPKPPVIDLECGAVGRDRWRTRNRPCFDVLDLGIDGLQVKEAQEIRFAHKSLLS